MNDPQNCKHKITLGGLTYRSINQPVVLLATDSWGKMDVNSNVTGFLFSAKIKFIELIIVMLRHNPINNIVFRTFKAILNRNLLPGSKDETRKILSIVLSEILIRGKYVIQILHLQTYVYDNSWCVRVEECYFFFCFLIQSKSILEDTKLLWFYDGCLSWGNKQKGEKRNLNVFILDSFYRHTFIYNSSV